MAKSAADAARVIAVNRFYWPDHSATSQILTDLVTHLAREQQPVTVITSRMRYDDPSARLPAREDILHVAMQPSPLWPRVSFHATSDSNDNLLMH